jgi:hypothetical protein
VFVVAADGAICKQVTGLAWRQTVSAQVFEEAAVDLGRALSAYWSAKRAANAGRPIGFPRYKRKGRSRDTFRIRNKRQQAGYLIRVGEGHPRSVTLPKIGRVRVHDDTRRLRRLLRSRVQIDSVTGEQRIAPTAKILFATIARRGTRWYVSLSVQAPDFHPERRHQPRSGYGGAAGMSGWTWALSRSPSQQGLTGPKSAAGTPTVRSPAAFAGYGDAPAPCHVPAAAPAATPELPGGFRANTPGSPTPAEASFTRSQASWSRTTPGWQSRTLPSTTCSAMAPLPAPSGMPPGRGSPASWPIRPNGSAPSSWSVTAGSRRVGHARGVERRESGWGWPSGYFAVMPASSSWTEIATPPPTSPPGPSTPGLRTAKPGGRVTNASGGEGADRRFDDGATSPGEGGTRLR